MTENITQLNISLIDPEQAAMEYQKRREQELNISSYFFPPNEAEKVYSDTSSKYKEKIYHSSASDVFSFEKK